MGCLQQRVKMTTLTQINDENDEGQEVDITEIRDCYCPNCGGENAVTVMLPTKIPMFREIIIMSLTCQVRAF